MDWLYIGIGLALGAMIAAVVMTLLGRARTANSDAMLSAQAALGGRIAQLAETQASTQATLSERLQAQERALALAIEHRMADMTKRLEDAHLQSSHRQSVALTDLRERLAVIDTAQKNITELSAQMVSLQDVLSNKQARGAFGEIQLMDLVRGILPPSAYEFQAAIGDGRRVDCLLRLPNPPGAIAVDAKFPLESWHALRQARDESERTQAGKAFGAAILKHVRDIAERYIVPGQTAESALMFLPAEAIYAELHANFPDVVDKSYRARVWIVSPTTLMATLNTVRAILKDAHMREQAGVIQKEVVLLLDDIKRLDDRVGALTKHFDQAIDDVRQIRISTDKVAKRSDRIQQVELGDDTPVLPVAP